MFTRCNDSARVGVDGADKKPGEEAGDDTVEGYRAGSDGQGLENNISVEKHTQNSLGKMKEVRLRWSGILRSDARYIRRKDAEDGAIIKENGKAKALRLDVMITGNFRRESIVVQTNISLTNNFQQMCS